MTFLSDAFERWEQGPYAMQAVATILHASGKVFVQLRTMADNIFDQVVLGSRTGTDEQQLIETLMAENGVDEIVTPKKRWPREAVILSPPSRQRGDILAAMARCEAELALLRDELSKHHDEV